MILWLYDSGAEEMQRNLFWLNDEQWRQIEPHLPTDVRGKDRVDDRRVISGILHVLKSGCRWCDCPPEYGPPTTIYNRFVRWAERGARQLLRLGDLGRSHFGGDQIAVLHHFVAKFFLRSPGRRKVDPHMRLHIILRHTL